MAVHMSGSRAVESIAIFTIELFFAFHPAVIITAYLFVAVTTYCIHYLSHFVLLYFVFSAVKEDMCLLLSNQYIYLYLSAGLTFVSVLLYEFDYSFLAYIRRRDCYS
jgi:hypothetical protein